MDEALPTFLLPVTATLEEASTSWPLRFMERSMEEQEARGSRSTETGTRISGRVAAPCKSKIS